MNKYDYELLASIRLKLANAQTSYEEIDILRDQEKAIINSTTHMLRGTPPAKKAVKGKKVAKKVVKAKKC